MSAVALLERLEAAGVELAVQGGRLQYRPVDAVPPDLLAQLRQHKPSLLALLTPAEPLDVWLAQPVPVHCEPPTDRPTVAELHVLAARMDTWIEAGTCALAASPDHPHAADATVRLEERRAARGALGELLRAFGNEHYDRERLAGWTAGQAFKQGDQAAVLEVVDAAHNPRWAGFLPGSKCFTRKAFRAVSDHAQPMEPATLEDRADLPIPGSGTTAAAPGKESGTRYRIAPGKECATRCALAPGKECAMHGAFTP